MYEVQGLYEVHGLYEVRGFHMMCKHESFRLYVKPYIDIRFCIDCIDNQASIRIYKVTPAAMQVASDESCMSLHCDSDH
jgi:hypothetical protein